MLTPPDLDLIRRDPDLPGMRLLLEPAQLLEKLDSLGLTGVEQLEPTYTRYKPQQSLLTAYRAKTPDGHTYFCAKAHREDARSKLADFKRRLQGCPGGVIDDLHTAVYPFQRDRKLTQIPDLLDSEARAKLLGATPVLSLKETTSLTTLRYKPERRYVAKLEDKTGAAVLVKHYTAAEFSRATAGVAAFHKTKSAGLVPTFLMPSAHLSVAPWLPGKPLDRQEGNVLGATEATGSALRSLHMQTGTGLKLIGRGAELNRLKDLADTLSILLPKLEPSIRQLLRRLCQRIEATEHRCVPLHGDFSADQVIVNNGAVTLLDFDNARLGDPAVDLGSFSAQLEWDTLTDKLPPGDASNLTAALLKGYGVPCPHHNLYTASALFRLAPHPFRQRRPDWSVLTEALLARAEAMLTGRTRELSTA